MDFEKKKGSFFGMKKSCICIFLGLFFSGIVRDDREKMVIFYGFDLIL
jgi:hypothetical protein